MRNLETCAKACMRTLDALKIPYSKNIRFTVNTRATSRLGLCRKTADGFIIEIAAVLLDERVDESSGLRDTLLHELLHTCRGCMNHTGRWKEYAERVNAVCGCNIRRTASPSEGIIPPELLPKPAYVLRCKRCGQTVTRQKRSQPVLHPERYRCAACKGELELLTSAPTDAHNTHF